MNAPPTGVPVVLAALLAAAPAAQRTGFWDPRPSLGQARQEVGAATVGGLLYVMGGLDTAGSSVATAERFDPATGVWGRIADLPTTLHHFGAAAAGGQLYVIGGYVSGFRPVRECWRYDPAGDRWSPIAPLPAARGALVAVAIGGRIYAVGGVVSGRGVVGDLTVYDPATDLWTPRAAMPTAREHLAAAELAGLLYAAGGRTAAGNLANLEAYDPGSDRWTPLAPMPTARGGNGAAALGGELLVCGGEGFSPSRTFPQTEAYDPSTGRWRTLEPMPTALHGIYPVTIGDQLLVAGGADVAGYGARALALAFHFLPDGSARFGASTPACAGDAVIGLDSRPLAGAGLRVSTWRGAPPGAVGALLLGTVGNPAGRPVLGVRLHVEPVGPLALATATADAGGAATVVLDLPAGVRGRAVAQFVWANTAGCGGAGTLSATDALDVEVR